MNDTTVTACFVVSRPSVDLEKAFAIPYVTPAMTNENIRVTCDDLDVFRVLAECVRRAVFVEDVVSTQATPLGLDEVAFQSSPGLRFVSPDYGSAAAEVLIEVETEPDGVLRWLEGQTLALGGSSERGEIFELDDTRFDCPSSHGQLAFVCFLIRIIPYPSRLTPNLGRMRA